jgi:hypothetical protein
MESAMPLDAEGAAPATLPLRGLGAFLFLGLLAWQVWMTATLFAPRPTESLTANGLASQCELRVAGRHDVSLSISGAGRESGAPETEEVAAGRHQEGIIGATWRRLSDDEPIVSGRHALHFYHALLGALSLRERGTDCCYDPAFQAGYPKTPVFDSGSRPAEFFLLLAKATFRPSAYKIGFAACCLAVPFLLLLSARGLGLGTFASLLATAFGQVVWWGGPCRQLLQAGDLDLLLASLAGLTAVGALVLYHRAPGPGGWIGLFASSAAGLFAQPILYASFFPLLLVYYLSVGARHRLAWHVALLVCLVSSVLTNCFWLGDWFAYWWVRLPLSGEASLLPHRTLHTLWAAPFWGEKADRALAIVLFGSGAAGLVLLNQRRQRASARLLGLGMCGLLLLAVAGVSWEPLGRLSTSRLLVSGLFFAALPAGAFWAGALGRADQWLRARGRTALVLVLGLAAGWLAGEPQISGLAGNCISAAPLAIGLSRENRELLSEIEHSTTPDARILWEERTAADAGSFWTPLLPVLTSRTYLGGLDPDGCIEHGYASLVDGKLGDSPVGIWTDQELKEFSRRYNVGWIVCRSPEAAARFQKWNLAERIAAGTGASSWSLFRLPAGSFAIKGQARLMEADCRHIALVDLVPADGVVVLSLHYQAGMRVSPSRVQIEKESDVSDPIPFIRLRMQNPVARVTLTWQQR